MPADAVGIAQTRRHTNPGRVSAEFRTNRVGEGGWRRLARQATRGKVHQPSREFVVWSRDDEWPLSESLLSCMTTNIRFKLPNAVVAGMLRQTVRTVYSPREVYRRFLWIIEHVHARQTKGRPIAETAAQQWFLAKFALIALIRVFYRSGVKAPFRNEFWSFTRELVRLKRRGIVDSVVQELLLVAPNAYHLIKWASVLTNVTSGVPRAWPV
jgi:hypothetical protein